MIDDRMLPALLVFEQGLREVEQDISLSQMLNMLDIGLVADDTSRLTSIVLQPYVPLAPAPNPHRDPPPVTSLVDIEVMPSSITPDLTLVALTGREEDPELADPVKFMLTRADLETLYRLIGTRIASLP